jgi:RND family efflux transporter MFP subunit
MLNLPFHLSPRALRRTFAPALALLATAIVLPAPASAQSAMPPPPVEISAPLKKMITEWDEYTGRFEAVQTVEVRPRVAGFIDRIHFRDGQTVKQGDLLFTIDPRPYQLSVDAARAEIARTQAQLELAENDVERAAPLVQNRTLAPREFDARRSAAKVALAALQSARAALAQAELNLEWTNVRAPIAGRISDRRVDVGNLVAGGPGAAQPTLLTGIVALDPIYFAFDASEADYLRYSRLFLSGDRPSGRDNPNPVEVRLADETTWARRGRMDFVDNQLNPRAGTIRGRAVFDNKDFFLVPGVFARMRLWAGDREALLVPDSAIAADQARRILLVVGADDTVQPRVVTLGPIVYGLRVIRSGLQETDRVIINGQANPMVRPGAKVTPRPGTIRPAS